MKAKKGEKVFNIINATFLITVSIICLAPLVHTFALSLSSSFATGSGIVFFWPVEFTTINYTYLIDNPLFWRSMFNSVVRVIAGTSINIILSCLIAYPLSKTDGRFKWRQFYVWLFFIPLVLNGGLIPTFIVVKETHIINTLLSLILPSAVPVFYVLVLLNFFRNIPKEFEEATIIDGGGQWTVLIKIFLPISVPAIATIAVYTLITNWNSWFDGIIYLDKVEKYPLLSYLHSTIIQYNEESLSSEELQNLMQLSNKGYSSAQVFVAALPIICVYPFLQKYFVKGLVLGGVKG